MKLTQDQRDAAYNNGAAVPGFEVIEASRVAQSRAFRAAHPGHLDLAYGPGARTKWDLFPAADPAAPCLVFIHGGWWQFGAREDNACIAAGVGAHGWSAALPGYTLAPDASLSQIVAEIGLALDWMEAHGPAHGIAGPVVLAGWSAGALLAVHGLAHRRVSAAVAFSGAYELEPLVGTYLDAKLRLTPEEVQTLSPLRLPPVAKPLTLACGADELEALRRDGQALHARRREVDRVGRWLPVAGRNHFTMFGELARADGVLTRAALALVTPATTEGRGSAPNPAKG